MINTAPAFLTALKFEDDGGTPYVLCGELQYASAQLRRLITIPIGFKTDLASIPRPLWNLLPKSGKYDQAAVLHDYAYATALGDTITRAQADGLLREAMEATGVGRVTRWLIYSGVRVGGHFIWTSYRNADTHK